MVSLRRTPHTARSASKSGSTTARSSTRDCRARSAKRNVETKASSRRTATGNAVTEDVMTVTTEMIVTEGTADVLRSPRLLTQERES